MGFSWHQSESEGPASVYQRTTAHAQIHRMPGEDHRGDSSSFLAAGCRSRLDTSHSSRPAEAYGGDPGARPGRRHIRACRGAVPLTCCRGLAGVHAHRTAGWAQPVSTGGRERPPSGPDFPASRPGYQELILRKQAAGSARFRKIGPVPASRPRAEDDKRLIINRPARRLAAVTSDQRPGTLHAAPLCATCSPGLGGARRQ